MTELFFSQAKNQPIASHELTIMKISKQAEVDDSQEQFFESCDHYQQYPRNLLRTAQLHHLHRRDDHFMYLEEYKEKLFSECNTNI